MMNQYTDKESIVPILFVNIMVHVNLLGLPEERHELVVREVTEFQLERQGGLNVTDSLLLDSIAIGTPQSEVQRVLSMLTNDNCYTADTTLQKS